MEITSTAVETSSGGLPPELAAALGRLDNLLQAAVLRSEQRFTSDPAAQRFRGLYISERDAFRSASGSERLFDEESGAQEPRDLFTDEEAWSPGSRFGWLGRTFGLTSFDLSILAIAIAPEVDVRYGRTFAFLQDDVTRRHASVGLILELLCRSDADLVRMRERFRGGAPLLKHELIHVAYASAPSSIAAPLHVDEQIVHLLLEIGGMDSRIAPFARVGRSGQADGLAALPGEFRAHLSETVATHAQASLPLAVLLHGPPGSGKSEVARSLAGQIGRPLLVLDLAAALATHGPVSFGRVVRVAFREAWFSDALIAVDSFETLVGKDYERHLRPFLEVLSEHPGPALLLSRQKWTAPAGTVPALLECPLGTLSTDVAGELWSTAEEGAPLEGMANQLARRFALSAGQITDARRRASLRFEPPDPANSAEWEERYFAEARAQSGQSLESHARRVTATRTWNDLVLPTDSMNQLREMCGWVKNRSRVLDSWGFAKRLATGTGVAALFSGPSGTGKTMAAEIVAGELGVDLFRVDLAGVISKYIGETEKNLEKIFRAAEDANGVLFFDEADALFGKRSEVRDSHDRYANIEISYLLQRMEEYRGVAILATNLRGSLDDAFVRRLAFAVHFPFPTAESRLRIWNGVWPEDAPLDPDLPLDSLAEQLLLSGGNIRNVALTAAYGAAARDGTVALSDVLHGVRREFQKMGKEFPAGSLEGLLDGNTADLPGAVRAGARGLSANGNGSTGNDHHGATDRGRR